MVRVWIEEPARERESLLAEVYERLAIIREDGRHAVLIIDDAQALASPETLAEVCGLLKLEYEDRRLLSLVLAGTPRLAEALASDPVLAHRVDVKVHLEPLDALTASAYLAHRLQGAGGAASILEPEAVAALHRLGRGIPGLMNTLADNALFEAFLCGRTAVSPVDVERAHRDLGWDAGVAAQAAAPDRDASPRRSAISARPAPAAEEPLDALDSELEAVFEPAASAGRAPFGGFDDRPARASIVPEQGPPKQEDDEPIDLLVELLDD